MAQARTLRLTLSLVLALFTAALCGLSVQRKIQTFQPLGFEPAPMAHGGGLTVAAVSDPRTGLVAGDIILLVEGHEMGNPAAAAEQLRGRAESKLFVMRGEPREILYRRPPVNIDFPYLILSLIGVGYLLIGLYMLLRQAGSQGLLFYLWCLTSAAFYLLTPVGPPGPLFTAIYLGDELTRIFLPALTLHMFLLFPSPLDSGRWSRRIVPFLYLPAAALLSLTLDLALANGRWIFGQPTAARLTTLDHVELFHLALFALASLAVLVYRMARSRDSRDWEQQRQLQWVAFGLGGGYLPFLLLYVGPLVLGLRMPEVLTSLAVVPLAFVPLAFAYAILRYKLWDIEVIVRDTITSTMTLLLGIIGFSLVNLAISRGVPQELVVARNLLSFVSGLAIAGLLVPTRRHFSSALERLQYRGTFGKRQALQALGRELLHQRNLGELCQALLHDIAEGVSLERVNLYLCQGGEMVAAVLEPGLPGRLGLDALGEEIWQAGFQRLSGVALPCEPMSLDQRLFVAGYRYVFPLTVRGRGIGLALTGYREDQTPLNSDDTELIRHLLDQASLAIENAQLLGQLHRQLEEVQRLQRYTEGIFESSPAGIAVLDRDGLLVSANAAFVAIAGVAGIGGGSREDLLAQPIAAVLPLDPLPAPGELAVEVPWTDPAGRERVLQVSTADFDRGQGLWILMAYDVTERVAMENALKEKDRLAALGMLAAGVAHEVNTPITGISSYAQMLLSETAENDPHYAILKKVERQTFRAARIVNNLLEFARNRQKDRGPVEVPALVTECLDLLSDRLEKRRIAVEWQPPQESVRVLGCDGELQQVFANLILNALDAITGTPGISMDGKLTLACEADAEKVRLRVQDNGPGIPADKLQTIFQPFYSTKLNRGGTGLGLSISHEIVRRHGGELRVESEPGQGSCFTVELPRIPPARALSHSSTQASV